MRKKIYLLALGVCLLTTVFSGLLVSLALGEVMEEQAKIRLSDLAGVMWSSGLNQAQPEQAGEMVKDWAQELAEGEDIRLTLLDSRGEVLADSHADAAALKSHADRPEVRQAMQTGDGWNIRRSDTLGSSYLYVARADRDSGRILRLAMPLASVDHAKMVVAVWTGLGGLGALLLAAGILMPLTARFVRPVKHLREAAGRIARGDYDVQPEVGNDEIGLLGEDFSSMAAALRAARQRETSGRERLDSILRAAPLGILAVDSRERLLFANPPAEKWLEIAPDSEGKSMMPVLRSAAVWELVRQTLKENQPGQCELNGRRILQVTAAPIGVQEPAQGAVVVVQDMTELRRLENLRSEFASNVSHELRTPLTSIRGYVETLRSGVAEDPEVRKEILDILDIQSERLSALIDDLLSLSELEAGEKNGVSGQACDLTEAVREALTTEQTKADALHIRLEAALSLALPVAGREDRMTRMALNLIDNAVKYNRPGGWVRVCTQPQGAYACLTVEDNGIGIAPEHGERIFERFYRVDKGRSRQMGGTGLGLSIVKHLVRLYAGDISYISREGEGTCFTVRFPLKSQTGAEK
ncbi:MAG: ATP-binding protein [Eubacteriales bacterium]|nr:ATP-binding protein [Eubacteriales bacterium]